MLPGEILDAQADLIDRLQYDPIFKDYLNDWALAAQDRKRGDPSALLLNHVRTAYAYRVSSDMAEVVKAAAAQLEDLDQFDARLAPTGAGIVSFDVPLPVIDIRGRTMLIHWLLWGPASATFPSTNETMAIGLWAFNDTWRQPDEVASLLREQTRQEGYPDEQVEEFEHHLGRWGGVAFDLAFDSMRMGPPLIFPSQDQIESVMAEGCEPQPSTNVLRYVHALWLLLNQTIVKVAEEEIPRAHKRRALRHDIRPHVSVIRLRREEVVGREPGEPGEHTYSVKWLVRGHWRWQVCGPTYPGAVEVSPGQYRSRLWVQPYVKGPEDAPFKVTKKIYSLDR